MQDEQTSQAPAKDPGGNGGVENPPAAPISSLALLAGAGTVVLLVLFAGIAVTVLSTSSPRPAIAETINLTISPGPGGVMAYSPTNFTVHAGDDVKLVITNHDVTTSPAPPLADSVSGTQGGMATYKLGTTAAWTSFTHLSPTDISHTFSVDFGSHVLNVPVPPAGSAGGPSVVTFEVVFSHSGTYTWYCDALCQGLPMTAPGPMAGFVHVT